MERVCIIPTMSMNIRVSSGISFLHCNLSIRDRRQFSAGTTVSTVFVPLCSSFLAAINACFSNG